jgi:hypothetical protein
LVTSNFTFAHGVSLAVAVALAKTLFTLAATAALGGQTVAAC